MFVISKLLEALKELERFSGIRDLEGKQREIEEDGWHSSLSLKPRLRDALDISRVSRR